MSLLIPLLRGAGMKLTGRPRYIATSVFMDDLDKITLGERVVISSHVSLLTHDYSLTTVLIAHAKHEGGDVAVVRPIVIGNNVFIGRGSIIMPGATIGDNVIIGSGAVVRGRVASGSVLIGNPAEPVTTLNDLYEKHLRNEDATDIRKDK